MRRQQFKNERFRINLIQSWKTGQGGYYGFS